MQKKLSQNAIVTANAISFAGAVIFGGIGIFAGIANFTKGGWNFISSATDALVPGVGTGFFLTIIGLMCGLIAMFTLKKISDAERLKKTYAVVSGVAGTLTAALAIYAVSVIIFALIGAGAGGSIQKTLWLDCFLPAVIVAGLASVVAYVGKQIAKGSIKMLPTFTTIALCVASLGALLMIISTIVTLYSKTGGSSYGDIYNDIFNMFN